MKDFKTTHNLDFESGKYKVFSFISIGMRRFDRYRVGTCEGLWSVTDKTYDILVIENLSKGNGHLTDVFEWFEHSCKRDKKAFRFLEVWNMRFKKHLIEKKGFKEISGSRHVIKSYKDM